MADRLAIILLIAAAVLAGCGSPARKLVRTHFEPEARDGERPLLLQIYSGISHDPAIHPDLERLVWKHFHYARVKVTRNEFDDVLLRKRYNAQRAQFAPGVDYEDYLRMRDEPFSKEELKLLADLGWPSTPSFLVLDARGRVIEAYDGTTSGLMVEYLMAQRVDPSSWFHLTEEADRQPFVQFLERNIR